MLFRSTALLGLASALALGCALSACASKPAADTAADYLSGPALESQLKSQRWSLQSATDGQGQRITALFPRPNQSLVLLFVDGRLAVQGGCNTQGGSYQISSTNALQVGPLMSTRKGCEPALMQADTAVNSLLAHSWQIQFESVKSGAPALLRLVSAAGETLVWVGEPLP
ncbi:META domain-containing protein [Rhodoferax sp.]|uniref:META domain-containing protein n=1 Tax=Rhodoferax sp. TaxID=50421 RepID=UPI00374D4FF4